jgi:hypothetical protein
VPDKRIPVNPWRTTLDASLSVQLNGLHLFALTDAQRYIVRRLMNYAHREEQYYVELNDDGTYTTPSAEQMDTILSVVDDLEDRLMALPDYAEGEAVVELIPLTAGYIYLDPAWDTLSWTRIGRVVFLSGRLVVSSVSGPVGVIRMIGLPYQAATGAQFYSAISILGNVLLGGATTALQGAVLESQSYAHLMRYEVGNAQDLGSFVQAGTVLIIGGQYQIEPET